MTKTRKQQRADVTDAVLRESYRLFSERGYKKTTIEDISKATGILVGSIYNIFKDKDDIVCGLIVRNYELIMEKAGTFTEKDNIITTIAFPMAVQFSLAQSNINIGRIMYTGYTMPKTMKSLSDIQCDLVERYYSAFGLNSDDGWIRRRIYAINGTVGGLISEICEDDGDVYENLKLGVEMYCSTFGIPCFDSKHVADKAWELVEENPPGSFMVI